MVLVRGDGLVPDRSLWGLRNVRGQAAEELRRSLSAARGRTAHGISIICGRLYGAVATAKITLAGYVPCCVAANFLSQDVN